MANVYDIYGNALGSSNQESGLNGLRWLCIGDSITTQRSYKDITTSIFGMVRSTNSYGSNWSIGYGKGVNYSVYEKIVNGSLLSFEKPDIITIALGTNDYSGKCPLGTIEDTGIQTAESYTFYGCYKGIIEKMYAVYGVVPIVLITPTQRTDGENLERYADAIIEIAEYYSFPVCDLYHHGGLPVCALGKDYTADGLHLTYEGHQIVANKIADTMKYAAERFDIKCTKLEFYYNITSVEITDPATTKEIFAKPSPDSTTEKFVFTSTDTAVATVDTSYNKDTRHCKITPVASGSCQVVCTCGNQTARVDVTVRI